MIRTDGARTIAHYGGPLDFADVIIGQEGSIYLVRPITARAKAWIDHNVDVEQTWGGAIVVDQHYIVELVDGMHDSGLRVA